MNPTADVTLQFLGAAGTVTGSRYLVESAGTRLLVDCGLFQGYKVLRERNRRPFPVEPETLDAVVLTHAHLDHSGYLPKLIREGFRGEVFCTAPTRSLCSLLLPDSGRLLEEEARYAAAKGYSKHERPEPLYTEEDARAALRRFKPVAFDAPIKLFEGWTLRYVRAGHILGAAQATIEVGGSRLHFTGDLGRPVDALLPPPSPLPDCDVLVCESTYGDRQHPAIDAEAELAAAVGPVLRRGGVVVVPAFAVGRAQELLLHLARLQENGVIAPVPVYLNSPMAASATELYRSNVGEHRLTREECDRIFAIATVVDGVEASKALNRQHGPMIIVSASGMLTGGRVLHHVVAFGGDRRNAILLSGYQAGGTRGAALRDGKRSLRMFGRDVAIEAEVIQLGSFSAHVDAPEMMAWLGAAHTAPRMTYVTHGEPAAADALRLRIQNELHWPVRVPDQEERVLL
ncbi:MBL fold metallo-hydrolase [Cognatilysobacter lacus]|uniref:MBL fold metallo-hydrolase n=1 Tax=Cognatilysobacter lacus TaxID=1643323 RepID=A0A5D8Z723_9GAMM|nr:MBL fold metallo-hydrolase [Lysobacter lacus]TZF90480.1 MBL fold metallo-hydrolase [Lysobacter lacus]